MQIDVMEGGKHFLFLSIFFSTKGISVGTCDYLRELVMGTAGFNRPNMLVVEKKLYLYFAPPLHNKRVFCCFIAKQTC